MLPEKPVGANGNLSNCFPGLWIRSLKRRVREKKVGS